MAERKAQVQRKTNETDVRVELNLDGRGSYEIDTGVGFFDHMLTHLSKHSKIDLLVKAKGDLEVDAHHTVEDIAICLGQCLDEALGDKKGIARYGSSSVPMEDTLANVAIDLSGRASFVYNVEYGTEKIGDFDVECLEEMLRSFSSVGKFNLHINVSYGTNSHHIAEAIFKALGQALGGAVRIVGEDIPSTKGIFMIEDHNHEYRVGIGTDIHPFAEGRKLMLGGLYIEGAIGLDGHSDADVVLHCVIDALLGAAGMGDIGTHFPDSDPKYKGADSKELLLVVKEMLFEKRWEVENIDIVITASQPRLEKYKAQIKRCIASLLGVDFTSVNVKAKTNNGFGAEGRGEAISAISTVLIKRKYKRTL